MEITQINGMFILQKNSNTLTSNKKQSVKSVQNNMELSIENKKLRYCILARYIQDKEPSTFMKSMKEKELDVLDLINGINCGYTSNIKYKLYNRYKNYIPEYHLPIYKIYDPY